MNSPDNKTLRASDNHEPITLLDKLIIKFGDLLSTVFSTQCRHHYF